MRQVVSYYFPRHQIKTSIGPGIFLVVILFLWWWTPKLESANDTKFLSKEDLMNFEHGTETILPAIPALDASAPNVLETAAFGLG
jgi:hypothetical protein